LKVGNENILVSQFNDKKIGQVKKFNHQLSPKLVFLKIFNHQLSPEMGTFMIGSTCQEQISKRVQKLLTQFKTCQKGQSCLVKPTILEGLFFKL